MKRLALFILGAPIAWVGCAWAAPPSAAVTYDTVADLAASSDGGVLATTRGFNAPGDGGGGEFRKLDAACVYVDNATCVRDRVGDYYLRQNLTALRAEYFGAQGVQIGVTPTVDATAALQAELDAADRLCLPAEFGPFAYRISKFLVLRDVTDGAPCPPRVADNAAGGYAFHATNGLRFEGQGKRRTLFYQSGEATPGDGVFEIAYDSPYLHSLDIGGFGCVFKGGVDMANRKQSCLFLSPRNIPNGAPAPALYLGRIHDIDQQGGFYAITNAGYLIWGEDFDDIESDHCAFITETGGPVAAPDAGRPNNALHHLYCNAPVAYDGAGFPALSLIAWTNTQGSNWEINGGRNISWLSDVAGGGYRIEQARIESQSYDDDAVHTIFDLPNGILSVGDFQFANITLANRTTVYGVDLTANGNATQAVIDTWQDAFSKTGCEGGGAMFYLSRGAGSGGVMPPRNIVRIDSWYDAAGAFRACEGLADNAQAAADTTVVSSWNDPSLMTFEGAAATVTLRGDETQTLVWSAALTGDVTIRLPPTTSNLLFSGRRYCFVVPTAQRHAITIKSGAATLATIVAGRAKACVAYNHSLPNGPLESWVLVDRESL